MSRNLAASATLLHRFGESALKPRGVGKAALINLEEAMQLREAMYKEGQTWPYEHLVPGPPQPPPGAELYLKRKAEKAEKKQARLKEIQEAMSKMPKLVSEYRAMRELDWATVAPIDKLTMTKTAIRHKYLRAKLSKQ